MKPNRLRTTEINRKAHPLLLLLVLSLCLLLPQFSFGADLEVRFDEVTPLDGKGPEGRDFRPGDEIRVRVRLSVLQATGNPFSVRLRIAGDGWREMLTSDSMGGDITYTGLRVPATAGEGKVSILMDAFSTQDTVALHGRRHAYLNIQCPPGLPAGVVDRLPVGSIPRDMALTADERYLYVTSEEERKVTVINVNVEEKTFTEIEDSETIGFPAGVAPSPSGREMYITDSALQAIHVVDAETHVLQETIRLNPTGDFGVTSPGGLAVNPVRNEAYVIDSRSPRVFIVDLASQEVRDFFYLFNLPGPPAGLLPLQVMLDPDNPRFIYVLCQGLNEVIKLDVVSGAIVDFVQLRDLSDPSTLWPAWSMALNPMTDEIYVVVNPSDFGFAYPTIEIESKIIVLPKNWLGGPGRREVLLEGSSIWDLAVREDGLVYAIDSYRGEILIIDMDTGIEMSRCAIPVEPGGSFLRADRAQNRLFVAGGLAGFVNIVE